MPGEYIQKKPLTVVKFGGKLIGPYGEGIPLIIGRIKDIREKDGTGPVCVFSAPEGLTNHAIEIGKKYAEGKLSDGYEQLVKELMEPYNIISEQHMKGSFKSGFMEDIDKHSKEVIDALKEVSKNKEFKNAYRARVLAHTGELVMAKAMGYVLNSYGIDSMNVPFEEWPINTDENFESAGFDPKKSKEKIPYLKEGINKGKVLTIGGFIGKTPKGIPTTYERGGSDRTAVDLGILLSDMYEVTVDLEKDSMVMSADPKIEGIDKRGLEKVLYLSYNEARLGDQYGMKIFDSSALRDIPPGIDIPIFITNMNNPNEVTKVGRQAGDGESPIKIVTGRKGCAILDLKTIKRKSLIDFLKGVKRYYEFTDLNTYEENDEERSRFLFFDGKYVKSNLIDEIRGLDESATIEYDLAAVTLIGDRMGLEPNVAAIAFGAIEDIVVSEAYLPRPKPGVLIIVKEDERDKCVSAIHAKKIEMNKNHN